MNNINKMFVFVFLSLFPPHREHGTRELKRRKSPNLMKRPNRIHRKQHSENKYKAY